MKRLSCILFAMAVSGLLWGASARNFTDSTETQFDHDLRATLWYLPNRLLDLADVCTLEVGFGAASDLGVQLTGWSNFGWETGSWYLAGSSYPRRWMAGTWEGSDYALGCWAARDWRYSDAREPWRSYDWVTDGLALVRRSDLAYKRRFLDPWAVGMHAGLLVHARLMVHPLAFWDFLLGWGMVDPDRDDR